MKGEYSVQVNIYCHEKCIRRLYAAAELIKRELPEAELSCTVIFHEDSDGDLFPRNAHADERAEPNKSAAEYNTENANVCSIRYISEAECRYVTETAYDESRAQYDAAYILNDFERALAKDKASRDESRKVPDSADDILNILIVNEDLYYPGYEFLYGAAYRLRAFVSDHRIDTDENFKKELFHELGHALGLKHCRRNCVMRPEGSRHGLDDKPMELCGACRKKLRILKASMN